MHHGEPGIVLRRVTALAAGVLVFAACGGGDAVTPETEPTSQEPPSGGAPEPEDEGCAHVLDVSVRELGGTYSFDVTVRSSDTGWDKYADAWEVRAPDGAVLGVRELLHPHENEQPFTRSLRAVGIPASVREVTVAARDSVVGFCGDTVTVALPGRT